MSDQKKPRVMSCKGFLHKSTQKAAASAAGFISAHREFLLTGELSRVTSPILARLDKKEVYPTPALQEIRAAVLGHIMAKAVQVQEAALDAATKEPSKKKPYTATIYDAAGNVMNRVTNKGEIEDLSKSFDLPQRACGWVDRNLFIGGSDWYGEVSCTKAVYVERIERADSIARLLKKKKEATCHQKSQTTNALSFGVRCKQDRQSFSHG